MKFRLTNSLYTNNKVFLHINNYLYISLDTKNNKAYHYTIKNKKTLKQPKGEK